jgi:hypothetical protein
VFWNPQQVNTVLLHFHQFPGSRLRGQATKRRAFHLKSIKFWKKKINKKDLNKRTMKERENERRQKEREKED